MTRAGWLDVNQDRGYPFIEETVGRFELGGLAGLPNEIICDAGIVVGLDSGFSRAGGDYVYLDRIDRRVDGVFEFVFKITSFDECELVFTRSAADKIFIPQFKAASVSKMLPIWRCHPWEVMSGFLVTGDMTWLANNVDPDSSLTLTTGNKVQLEPCTIKDMTKSRVRSISVANLPRATVTEDDCSYVVTDLNGPYRMLAACLFRKLHFCDAISCQVDLDEDNNAVIFTASPGIGEGYACEPLQAYAGEATPIVPTSPGCSEIITSLGGAIGSKIQIVGGNGVTVVSSGSEITITVDPQGGDACNG